MSMIIAAKRSAIVPRGGAFKHLALHQLAQPVIHQLLENTGIACERVQHLFVSNALGAGGNPARAIGLACAMKEASGTSIDAQCAGGLDAIAIASAYVDAGFADIVIAGGVESFSQRPLRARLNAAQEPVFYTQADFSPFAEDNVNLAAAAAALAEKLAISRKQQEAYAVFSHHKACLAQALLQEEIVPINGIDKDPFTRHLTPEIAARSRALHGSVSVASTAVEADGAAFCLIVSDALAKSYHGIKILAHESLGSNPKLPGMAAAPAITALLQKTALTVTDIQHIELMEAFSAQALACIALANLPKEKVNPLGGALAFGHPIGASGALLVCRAFHQLQRTPGIALCAIPAAGGIGSALLLTTEKSHAATT